MSYTVRLDLFEGPLDLLLYLIRKEEIEVTDIPMVRITKQYLAHLDTIQALEMDGAGEYLLMAATLLRIKSRMLLPRHGEDDDVDPRQDLVERLLEYKRYRAAAERFDELARERGKLHDFVPERPLSELRSREEIFSLNFFDLLGALRDVMGMVADREARHRVEMEAVTIEEKVDLLRESVQTGRRFRFRDLFAEAQSRQHVIVTFMAMLELMRLGEIRILQHGQFAEIWIERVMREQAVMARAASA